jgi:hypothetical protein
MPDVFRKQEAVERHLHRATVLGLLPADSFRSRGQIRPSPMQLLVAACDSGKCRKRPHEQCSEAGRKVREGYGLRSSHTRAVIVGPRTVNPCLNTVLT